jgi:hypothetical protein
VSDQTSKYRIEDVVGDAVVAQKLVNLANEEDANLADIAALLEKKVAAHQITEWLQDGTKLNGAATLLDQGVAPQVATQLINNRADLRDIATNSQILLSADIRLDLVNEWLKNGTHLNDAIAIMNLGIDLNLIGTSSKVGDFTGLAGATPNEVVARISQETIILPWKPDPGRIEEGMKFRWTDISGQNWKIRMHEPDIKAPVGSHAASGWIVRIQRDNYYMDDIGNFYKENWLKPTSSRYNPANANATHIPIQKP